MKQEADTLTQFQSRRAALSNLSYSESRTRFSGFYTWLSSQPIVGPLVKDLIKSGNAETILSVATRNTPPSASSLEEITSIGLYSLKLAADGIEPYRFAIDHGISPPYRTSAPQTNYNALMQRYVEPALNYVEEQLATQQVHSGKDLPSVVVSDAAVENSEADISNAIDWTWNLNAETQIWSLIRAEYDISKKGLASKIGFVTEKFTRSIIFRDIAQSFRLADLGYAKPAVILAGSVCEELIRNYLSYKGVKPKKDTFDSYIDACNTSGLLKAAIQGLATSVRHFRNLVHMTNEKTRRHTISKSTAKAAVASIFSLANDFQK